MDQTFLAWSHSFLEWPEMAELTSVQLCEKDWRDVHSELIGETGSGRIFAKVVFGQKSFVCNLGSPVRQDGLHGAECPLFVPLWMLDRIGCDGCGDEVRVTFLLADAFSEATKIILRPHDSAFYDVQDVKSDLEGALTVLGVVEKGTTVMLPLSEMGGELMPFDIVETEPASVVLCQGDEVVIDFEEAADRWDGRPEPEPEPEPAPAPAPAQAEPEPPKQYTNPWRHKDFTPPYSRDEPKSHG
jgi:hypothetical protein